MQQALGIDVELMGHDEAQAPVAGGRPRRLRRVRLRTRRRVRRRPPDSAGLRRRRAPRRRPPAPARAGGRREVVAGRAIGVVLADGSRIGAAHVVLAAGPWSAALAAGVGIDLPVRAQRAQILLVDPGRSASGRSPSSPTWCRCSTCAPRARADPARRLRPLRPRVGRPRRLPRAGERRRAGPVGAQVRPPLPRLRRRVRWPPPMPAATTSPPTTTRSSRPHPSRACGCAPASRVTATRSRRRSASSWPT